MKNKQEEEQHNSVPKTIKSAFSKRLTQITGQVEVGAST